MSITETDKLFRKKMLYFYYSGRIHEISFLSMQFKLSCVVCSYAISNRCFTVCTISKTEQIELAACNAL